MSDNINDENNIVVPQHSSAAVFCSGTLVMHGGDGTRTTPAPATQSTDGTVDQRRGVSLSPGRRSARRLSTGLVTPRNSRPGVRVAMTGDVSASFGERKRDGRAKSSRRACDQGHLPLSLNVSRSH